MRESKPCWMEGLLLQRMTNYCVSSGIAFLGVQCCIPSFADTDSCKNPLLVHSARMCALIRLHPLLGIGTIHLSPAALSSLNNQVGGLGHIKLVAWVRWQPWRGNSMAGCTVQCRVVHGLICTGVPFIID